MSNHYHLVLHVDKETTLGWDTNEIIHGNSFGQAIGQIDALRLYASNIGQQWCQGLHTSKQLFSH